MCGKQAVRGVGLPALRELMAARPLVRLLDVEQPAARFVLRVALVSSGAIAALLCAYLLFRPGALQMIAQGGAPAIALVLRQVAVNGLPVVVAATWAGAVLLGTWARRPGRRAWSIAIVDGSVRLLVLAAAHALTFILAADMFGSFGGDRLTALRVVAPTLARAAVFENLSGVYLYASLAIALPMQVEAMAATERGPSRPTALLVAALWSVVLIAGFTVLAGALAGR